MKPLFCTVFAVMLAFVGHAQSKQYIRADSVYLQREGGNAELILLNGSRNVNGILTNRGGGRTQFVRPRVHNDTLFIGTDTLLVSSNSTLAGGNITSLPAIGQSPGAGVSLSEFIQWAFYRTPPAPGIVVTYGWSDSDPYTDNSTAPTITNSATVNIFHDSAIVLPITSAFADKFIIAKVASTESNKAFWKNTEVNSGEIPDITWRAMFTVGGFDYYVSREPVALEWHYPIRFE